MPRDDEDDTPRPSRPRRRDDDDRDDRDDDRPRRRRRRDDDEDDYEARRSDATGGLIPYKNGMALAAYYCGVFAFVPIFTLILGPLAIIFGFLGLSKAKKHPEARGKGHAIAGIVLGSLTLLALIGGIIFMIFAARAGR
jgi:Domain of unknown function (DUF4190)